jgi:hypothetical protein
MSSPALTADGRVLSVAAGAPWILSRREDLLWFQGSVVAGVALLAVFLALPPLAPGTYALAHPAVLTLFLWGLLFDGTHVFATYARSYLAPDTASRAALPGPWSWTVLGVGPLLAWVDATLFLPRGVQGWAAGPLFGGFLLAAYLWAYWHLVRQHYGFLMLYRRKAGEHDQAGARFDSALLWAGCLYPYLRFSLTDAYAHSGLPQLVPAALLPSLRTGLDVSALAFLSGALALWLTGRVGSRRLAPKHLLLAVVIVFHCAVLALLDNLLAIMATLTIFHNLQYHRIVWQYERGLGRRPLGGLLPYFGFGLLFALIWYGPRILGVAVAGSALLRNALIGLGWGVAFHHYVVDARIWRVRRSPAVSQALDAGARA